MVRRSILVTGDNRTPKAFNWDLGLAYPISVGEGKELRLQLDWFNITNRQSAIRQDTTLRINSGATGVPLVDNPFFGQGTIFQFCRLRLGAKFKF